MSDTLSERAPVYVNSGSAPFIYFDFVPTYGIMNGAIQVEVAARAMLPADASGKVQSDLVCTAHIRCSPAAATELLNSLQKALEMLQQPAGPPAGAAMN